MNEYGLLGSYIPAFGRIVGQMQHDLFHVFTVDEHILNSATRTEDPWGNEFQIECDGDEISVASNGADGEQGTEDDIH